MSWDNEPAVKVVRHIQSKDLARMPAREFRGSDKMRPASLTLEFFAWMPRKNIGNGTGCAWTPCIAKKLMMNAQN